MQKFLSRTLMFVLPIGLMLLFMELSLRNIPNDYKFKCEYLDTSASKIETLILGSSHALYGLDPRFFSNRAFNVSHVSQDFYHDYAILNKYKDELISLKTIILPVAYNGFYKDMITSREPWRVKNYWIHYGIYSFRDVSYFSELTSFKLSQNLNRLWDYYINHKSEISCDQNGWGFKYSSKKSKDIEYTGKVAAKRHTVVPELPHNQSLYKMNFALLVEIVKIAEEKGVSVLLFTAPAAESYRDNLNQVQLQLMNEGANKLADAHNNCKYLDLLDDDRFINADFFDADHLNEKGAEKLSRLIEEYQERNKNK